MKTISAECQSYESKRTRPIYFQEGRHSLIASGRSPIGAVKMIRVSGTGRDPNLKLVTLHGETDIKATWKASTDRWGLYVEAEFLPGEFTLPDKNSTFGIEADPGLLIEIEGDLQ